MDSTAKKPNVLITVFAVVFSVIFFLAAFLTMWFWSDSYDDFADFEEELAIPGLKDGATPQGMANYNYAVIKEDGTYDKIKQDYIFVSAYFKNAPSRIYVTGKRTGCIGYVTVKNTDDTDYTGHAGGIATDGKTFWLSSDRKLYRMRASSTGYADIIDEIIKKSRENGEIKITGEFNANCRADFLLYYADPTGKYDNDRLFVGEFYNGKTENAETYTYYRDAETNAILKTNDENSYIWEDDKLFKKKSNGEKGDEVFYNKYTSHSVMIEYRPYKNNEYGLWTTTVKNEETGKNESVPSIYGIYVIPDEIQGAALSVIPKYDSDDDSVTDSEKKAAERRTLVLSQSYSLKNSNLLTYDFKKVSTNSNNGMYYNVLTGKHFVYEGVGKYEYDSSFNVYFVDGLNEIKNYSVPSMSEGLCLVQGRRENKVYVLFESGAKKYRTFTRQAMKSIYSFIPPEAQ